MKIFDGLKFQHKIYNQDFSSYDEFTKWFNNCIRKLEEISESVQANDREDWDMIENNQLAENLEDTVESIVNELEITIDNLGDKKNKLRG